MIELRVVMRRVWQMKSWSGDEKSMGKVNFENQSKTKKSTDIYIDYDRAEQNGEWNRVLQ